MKGFLIMGSKDKPKKEAKKPKKQPAKK